MLRGDDEVSARRWPRQAALHLFQFLVTHRRQPMPKEEIVDRLWPEKNPAQADRDFKVALNGLLQAIEPARAPRAPSSYIGRIGSAYGLVREATWVDADEMEGLIASANAVVATDAEKAVERYRLAVDLYQGDYLPDLRYEDWTTSERERLQTLALGAMTVLGRLMVDRMPLEALRLTERVLATDSAWEEAYRIQMRAYFAQRNRLLALRAYRRCVETLEREFGLLPLPETQQLYLAIQNVREH